MLVTQYYDTDKMTNLEINNSLILTSSNIQSLVTFPHWLRNVSNICL